MRAIFIRHGESTANTGLASADVASIALTQRGEGEASRIAQEWSEVPSLIVTSPFQRTKQTAAPTIARFPGVTVEIWPIEEFTYLQPARWNGTASADRRPHVERYWTAADPAYCDGEGAESRAIDAEETGISFGAQHVGRPLLTPDEVRALPGELELLFLAGQRPIVAAKLRYYV